MTPRTADHLPPPDFRPHAVGILGGMGPAAGADFVRLFVLACTDTMRARGLPVHDQGFPEHWLAQLPIPDRSRALEAGGDVTASEPFAPMARTLARLAALPVRAVAIACNTAHAWHGPLQALCPQIELLHIAEETAAHLAARGIRDAGLMATSGTYRTGLYHDALARAGVRCHLPSAAERADIMRGIYDGVKAGDPALAAACFGRVAHALAQRHPGLAVIMGCTEIPLALPRADGADALTLVDPAAVLATALARRAFDDVAPYLADAPARPNVQAGLAHTPSPSTSAGPGVSAAAFLSCNL